VAEPGAPNPVQATGQSVPVRLAPRPLVTESAVGSPPPPAAPSEETVTLTIDGRSVTARKGELMIEAAERAGVYVPRFCYHPRMKPVGMCRMCLVEVEGPRGSTLMPACYNPVADGMSFSTCSEMAKKAQDGVLELLLVNHPLDCPVCDKGGECPLQDQTLAYGPGESRFVEEKRHWDKPIPISELINLDRERCIQCGRCVRFADEVAGDPLIDFAERGDRTEVAIFASGEPYTSAFSGNIVQICPVGALTATPYRFRARPWDLEQVESTCTTCALGCRVAVQASTNQLVRTLGIDSDPVNWSWLCDKGRFGFEAVNSPERLTTPLVRRGDELVEATWGQALEAAASGLARARHAGGGESIAVIGGARLPNEDAYVWSKLARVVLGTDNVDAQLGDGLPADRLLALPRATIDQTAAAPLVITLGADVRDDLPVLYLRLRHAVREEGLQLVELSPTGTGASPLAALRLRYRPGGASALVEALLAHTEPTGEVAGVAAADLAQLRAHLRRAEAEAAPGGPVAVVVLGRSSLAEAPDDLTRAACLLASHPGLRWLPALRRSNLQGALDMGLSPGLLPGRVGLRDGRTWFEHHWQAALPDRAGLDTAGILAAAARGHIGGLVLVGADPIDDFPDRTGALKGMEGARFVVAVDTFLTASSRRADVVLPAATTAERRGSFTNVEGRVSHLGAVVTPPGVAWPDWTIAVELASRLGTDLRLSSLEEIWAEILSVSPLHAASLAEVAGLPTGDGVVLGAAGGAGRPRPIDPMADPGIASAELHALAPSALGAGPRRPARPAGAALALRTGGVEQPEGEAPPEPPAPLRLAAPPPAARPPEPDVAGSGRLVLLSRRSLWDAGSALSHSPHLARLGEPWVARLHPSELDRRGLVPGDRVDLVGERGSLGLEVAADAGLAPGCVAVPFNHPEGSAADLIDAASPLVSVRLVLGASRVPTGGGS